MKISMGGTLVLTVALLLISSAAGAAECSGSWQVLHNYNPGSGGVCAAIGLNTHQAVCQPGQRYATYCDDASGGRYRTCQSNVPCGRERRGQYGNGGFNDSSDNWDNNRRDDNRYYQDSDREYRRNQAQDCTQWDFQANRPCAAGTINRDCRNGCDGR